MTINHLAIALIKSTVAKYPEAKAGLNHKGRFITAQPAEYKSQGYFLRTLERMVRTVYSGDLGGEFIDIMGSLLQGQINDAYKQAWIDEDNDPPLPEYLTSAAEEAILNQFDYVDGFYRDIVDAKVDQTPIEPLLARCELWANRWSESYNAAVALIALEEGGRLVWKLGNTEKHCDTCLALNGIVANASTWDELDVHPQDGPNDKLDCKGYRCDCSLESTTQRQSPKAFDLILNAVTK